jgi:hypothetical protein
MNDPSQSLMAAIHHFIRNVRLAARNQPVTVYLNTDALPTHPLGNSGLRTAELSAPPGLGTLSN